MSPTCTLWCLVDGDKTIFSVDISIDRSIDNLKDSIKQKCSPDLDMFSAANLILWKLEILEPVKPATDLVTRIQSHGSDYSQFATELKEPSDKVLAVFANKPDDCLHVFISLPTELSGGKRPRSSSGAEEEAKRMKPDVDDLPWLTELHSKIWNCVALKETLFRTVKVTKADYDAFRQLLDGLHNCYTVKLKFLQSLSTTEDLPNLEDDEGSEAKVEDNNDDLEETVIDKLFPSVFRYLDLSSLELKNKVTPRLPLPLLIRDDYEYMTKLINDEHQDNSGSVIVSGQPGTGKTAYLFLRIVQGMIEGVPFLYQSIDKTVYHVAEKGVEVVHSWPSTEPISAFIDGDAGDCQPRKFLHDPSVQLIVTASPKGADQKWTKQMGSNSAISARVVKLWSRKELLLTGLFLKHYNLSVRLLEDSASYFGYNPRQCFEAALSVGKLNTSKGQVLTDINNAVDQGIENIISLLNNARSGQGNSDVPSRIFQIYPDPDDGFRSLSFCQVSVTPWALDNLVKRLEDRKSGNFARLYYKVSGIPEAATFLGCLYEIQVLRYLDRITTNAQFMIRRLTGLNPGGTTWIYPGPAERVNFISSTVRGQIEEAIRLKRAHHLVPLAGNFAAVDSIIYDPNDTVLTLIQITRNVDHRIAVSGLRDIQRWLKRDTASANLRPSKARRWRFLFVVPAAIASTFKLQTFKGDTEKGEWAGKVDQYVLGLNDETIIGILK